MTRALPVLVALLVLGSLAALPAMAGTPAADGAQLATNTDGTQYAPPVSVDDLDTTERIDFDQTDAVRSGFETPTADVGVTLGSDVARIDARYDTLRFEDAFENADSDAERGQLLSSAIDELETSLAEVRENERDAYLSYHNGDISTNELLVRLARVSVRASTIDSRAGAKLRFASEIDDVSDPEISSIQTATSELTGPVRTHAASQLDGSGESDRAIFVQAAENGIVLAMIDGDTFVREAFLADNRDPTSDDSIGSVTSALDRATELYPWTFSEATGTDTTVASNVYRVSANHPQGTLVTYLDGGTEAVFREVQEKHLDRLPLVETAHSTEANRTIVVERTYPGGPARITVLDDDDDPLSGVVVIVDDRQVGETDTNGELWIVAPRGGYDVTTVHQGIMSSVAVPGSGGSGS